MVVLSLAAALSAVFVEYVEFWLVEAGLQKQLYLKEKNPEYHKNPMHDYKIYEGQYKNMNSFSYYLAIAYLTSYYYLVW